MAFGYLVSGVFLYGLIGWLLDRWWGTSFLVVIGILAGAVLGTYQTWARFKPQPEHLQPEHTQPDRPKPGPASDPEQ